jgi:CAAX prenyl protease-like protein
MVLISSLLFAGYHYLGSEHFIWQTFVFRTAAGLYFGAIFVFRGFGITAGSHAAYDVMIVLLRILLQHHG